MRLLQRYSTIGETRILRDSLLVLLTVLQSSFEANPPSSDYTWRVCCRLNTARLFHDFFAALTRLNK